jgi:hypothetical protein
LERGKAKRIATPKKINMINVNYGTEGREKTICGGLVSNSDLGPTDHDR